MVRLVGAVTELVEYVEKFQFQYGAIGGCPGSETGILKTMFQFQYGAIGGIKKRVAPTLRESFNSSMVRLVVGHAAKSYHKYWSFNSSMVRLVVKKIYATDLAFAGFNSSMVRLVGVNRRGFARHSDVSIPVWCDWWTDIAKLFLIFAGGFNSSMVRLVEQCKQPCKSTERCFNSSMVRLVE